MDPKKLITSPTFDEMISITNTSFSNPFEEAPFIPTPPTYLFTSSMEEDDALKILIEKIHSLDIRILEIEKQLEK